MAEPSSSPGDESANWLKGMLTIAFLLGLGTLIGLLMLYGQQRPQASIADCRASNAPLTTVTGTLRQAGPDYYLVADDRWHLLQAKCGGKARQACLAASNHAEEWLEHYLGQAATAHICANGVVDYTVADRSFYR